MSNDNDSGFSSGFIIGGVFGLIGGLIFAPRPGEETRAIWNEVSNEWRERARQLSDVARDKIIDATNEGRRVAENLREEFEEELD